MLSTYPVFTNVQIDYEALSDNRNSSRGWNECVFMYLFSAALNCAFPNVRLLRLQ